MDSTWPLLSPGVFCLEDLAIKSDLQIRNLALQEFLTGKPVAAIKSAAPQIVSHGGYCRVVMVDIVELVNMRNECHSSNYSPPNAFIQHKSV